jgi:Methyltransferase domain
MPAGEWTTAEHVLRYLGRADGYPRRALSELMLEAARKRFADDERIELVKHDLAQPLPALGRFDAVASSFAIHHLEHERKRSLCGGGLRAARTRRCVREL